MPQETVCLQKTQALTDPKLIADGARLLALIVGEKVWPEAKKRRLPALLLTALCAW